MNWTAELIETAQRLYDDGYTPVRVSRWFWVNKRLEVSTEDVRSILDTHRNRAVPQEVKAEILRLRKTEWLSYTLICARLGVSRNLVEQVCGGIMPPKGVAIHGDQRRTDQGRRYDLERAKLICMPEHAEIEVPAWVPDHLHEFYDNRARRYGEEIAATEVRALKRGGSVAHL